MRHEVDRHSRLEKPLEEHPSVHVVKVVFLCAGLLPFLGLFFPDTLRPAFDLSLIHICRG